MSNSNCCFLTCRQISQEAGQVVWYCHLFQNFPQFVVIHTLKGFGVVNKAEIDVFLEFSCFFHDPADVGNLISGSSAFLNPAWTFGSSQFMYCWSLAWRILSITLLACEMSVNCAAVWAFFGIAFLWDWNENWTFPVLWPLLSFPDLLVYWAQHFNSIIFQDGDIHTCINIHSGTLVYCWKFYQCDSTMMMLMFSFQILNWV